MARPELTRSDTLKTTTDEDYESDDSDIDRLTTRLLDPAEDAESLVELETSGQTVLSFAEDRKTQSCSVFLAETTDEGPLAGIFLSDGEQYGEISDFLEIATGYEISPLSAQYLHSMISRPYKEGVTFEPLLKEIFASKVYLKFLYFLTESLEELPWYVKQFAKKLDNFDQNEKRKIYYIDSKDILPSINIAKATLKEESVLEEMLLKAVPEYPIKLSKILRGFVQTSHEPFVILGAYQQPLGVVITNQNVDVEALSRSYQLSAFNHLIAPQRGERLSSLSINCFQLVTFFMEWPANPVQVVSQLFSTWPDRDYCVMLLPRHLNLNMSVAALFFRVSPRPEVSASEELYLCHKMSLTAGVKVGWVRSSHTTGLTSLLNNEERAALILRDIQHSLETDGSDARTMVATCYDQVVGVAVFRREYDIHHLKTHYHADIGESPVRLHHLVVAPVFQSFARHFLGQILRLSGNSALVYPVFRKTSKETERFSAITVLDEFLMATPRHRILPLPLQPAATLFYINAVDAGQPLNVHQEKIVIIGSSPLALAAAEFFATKRLHSFPNLLLLTEDNLEADFSPNVVNLAPPAWGQVEMGRRKRLSLQSVVNIVVGRVTSIDRDNQRVSVNEGSSISYDKILLCVERSSYSLNNSFISRKGIRKLNNFFTLETLSAGQACLDWFQTSVDSQGREGYIIILGHNLHAIATINSLIELGAPAKCFLLVKLGEDLGEGDILGDKSLEATILSHLKVLGVRIKTYNLIDFKKTPRKDLIETVIFSKNDELVEASCLMLINCHSSCVSEHLLEVLEAADLVVLEDSLVVNSRLETSDPNILSAGCGTRMDRISGLRQESSERNPHSEGIFLAKMLFRQLVSTGVPLCEEEDRNWQPVKFRHHTQYQLPGGLSYLHLSNGEETNTLKCIRTSVEAGDVALYINPTEKISCLQVLYHGYIPAENLARLSNLHLRTLPGLEEAEDILQFLQQPKFIAVFHEGFQELREQIRRSVLAREDSGALIGEIVLNPERGEAERLERLRATWEEKMFQQEIKNNLRSFIEKYRAELPSYNDI